MSHSAWWVSNKIEQRTDHWHDVGEDAHFPVRTEALDECLVRIVLAEEVPRLGEDGDLLVS